MKKSPASLWIKSVAQIRWADLGDHRQGIKWIKCFNPLQQEKKKNLIDWLAVISKHEPLGCEGLTEMVRLHSLRSMSLQSSGESATDLLSAADVPGHRITSFICYIILLQNDAHLLTHADTHARSKTGSSMVVPFAKRFSSTTFCGSVSLC